MHYIAKRIGARFVATLLSAFLFAPSSVARVLFAAIGDYGDASAGEARVAALVSEWDPDFIITLGDNRYGSTGFDETVGRFFCDFLAEVESEVHCSGGISSTNRFFPSLGNHDYRDGAGLNEYLSYFTLPGTGVDSSNTSESERYYDFVRGPVHFFVIDSQGALSSRADREAQRNWLQAQLGASTAPWQIVFFHHPPYSSAGVHGSTRGMQWPFASWGADAVLSGHDHTYERLLADGIVYFVNGLGGKSVYPFHATLAGSQVRYNGDFGAMRVTASATSITFEFISAPGRIIDSYTLVVAPPTADGARSCTGIDCELP